MDFKIVNEGDGLPSDSSVFLDNLICRGNGAYFLNQEQLLVIKTLNSTRWINIIKV